MNLVYYHMMGILCSKSARPKTQRHCTMRRVHSKQAIAHVYVPLSKRETNPQKDDKNLDFLFLVSFTNWIIIQLFKKNVALVIHDA